MHALFRSIPGLATLSAALRERVPDLREVPAAALLELVLVAALLSLLLWRRRRARAEQPPGSER
jgi:hypothetical protein